MSISGVGLWFSLCVISLSGAQQALCKNHSRPCPQQPCACRLHAPLLRHLGRSLIYKLDTVRECPHGQHHYSCILEWLLSKIRAFPGGSDGKESACNAGDLGSIPGSGRLPGERNGNPLQSTCLENSMNRRAGWARVHGVAKSQTRLSD